MSPIIKQRTIKVFVRNQLTENDKIIVYTWYSSQIETNISKLSFQPLILKQFKVFYNVNMFYFTNRIYFTWKQHIHRYLWQVLVKIYFWQSEAGVGVVTPPSQGIKEIKLFLVEDSLFITGLGHETKTSISNW